MSYPHSGGVFSTGGGHVELSLTWISMDPLGFRVRWCGVGYIYIYLSIYMSYLW
jgi:hypothetical protein